MGTKADFYLEKQNKLIWFGSLFKNGQPWNIPLNILIQINSILFEEEVVSFLETTDSVLRQNKEEWPWIWADSRMTDYSYIFIHDQVFAYISGNPKVFDPISIIQGEDLNYASIPYTIKFPMMLKQYIEKPEEILTQHGYKLT